MLSLDLFDSRYEKKLHEGAVDDTIARLIDPLSKRAAEIKTQIRNGKLSGQEIDKLEKEYEDLVQRRLDIILDRKPQTQEAEQPQRAPAKGLLKGKDLVTPQQRVAGATPQKPGVAGAVKDVVGGVKRWLKGEPDQGPTYEDEELDEQDAPPPPQSVAQGIYNEIVKGWHDEKDYISLPFPDGRTATMTRGQIWNAIVALGSITDLRKRATYVAKRLNDFETFMQWLAGLKRYKVPAKKKGGQQTLGLQPQAVAPQSVAPDATAPSGPMVSPEFRKDVGLSERQNQKKKSKDANVKDIKLNRELQQARSKFPTAGSDLEAMALDQMSVNDKQDSVIKDLNQELSNVKDQNQSLTQTLQNLNAQVAGLAKREPSTEKPAAEPAKPTGGVSIIKPQPVAVSSTADAKARAEIEKLNKQIQQLELTIALKSPADQTELRDRIEALEKERDRQIQQRKDSAAKAVTTRRARAIKARPEKDMGPAVQVPPEQGQLPFSAGEYPDISDLVSKIKLEPETGDELTAKKVAKQAISKAKQTSKKKAAAIDEHGGGIGPRQHWQDLMPEGWSDKYNPTPYAVYIDGRQWKVFSTDDHARAVADKLRASLKQQGRDQTVTIAPSEEYLKTSKTQSFKSPKSCPQCGKDYEGCICEGTVQDALKDYLQVTGANDVEAVKSAIQKIGRDSSLKPEAKARLLGQLGMMIRTHRLPVGREYYQYMQRFMEGTAEQFGQAVRMAGYTGKELEKDPAYRKSAQHTRQEREQSQQNIAKVKAGYGEEPDEYRDMDEATIKEPTTRKELLDRVDRIQRMMSQERNPANLQIMRKEIEMLKQRYQHLKEDTASQPAEQAILKRIFVAHRDLLVKYGPEKIMQAAEEVAYNVGDIAEIGTSDVSGWVRQVEQILGARP